MREEMSWFIFGEHLDGRVDINDGERDVMTTSREHAERIIAAREVWLNELVTPGPRSADGDLLTELRYIRPWVDHEDTSAGCTERCPACRLDRILYRLRGSHK